VAVSYTPADDYPFHPSLAHPEESMDGWGFFTTECTSFAAWRIRHDLGDPGFRDFGDAYQWAGEARADGMTVTTTPSVGTVAVFPPNTDGAGPKGHVAVVLAVEPNNSLWVEDYNYASPADGNQYHLYSQHPIPDLPSADATPIPVSYIHFTPTPPAPTATAPRGGQRTAPPSPPQAPARILTTDAPAGLHERTAPDLTAPITATLPQGTVLAVICQSTGPPVTRDGTTSTTWDRLANGEYITDTWTTGRTRPVLHQRC
jgi:surface antigen